MRGNKGFIAIAPVLVIGGVIMVMAHGMAFRAHEQTMIAVSHVANTQAKYMADACAEIAIGKLQTIFGYAGNESIASSGITCDILTIGGTGNYNRTVITQATVKGYAKKIQVIITKISDPTAISSWKEI